MTKAICVCGMTAVLLSLSFGNVHAEDEPQSPQPVVSKDQESQPKPKEETAKPKESAGTEKTAEPECN